MTREERFLYSGRGKAREIRLSTGPRSPFRLCALAVLSVGLLFAPGAAQAAVNGGVVTWGCSRSGDPAPCAVPATATSGVTAIAAGVTHSLALKQDGSVIAWGCGRGNDHGQCAVPAAAASGVTAISASFSHSLALRQDGSVLAWGCGSGLDHGQCSVPPTAASGVTAIGASSRHSLALKQDGSVIAWGCLGLDHGQCMVPPTAASGVTAIAAAPYHSLALKQDGSVIAWGCGFNAGQCTVPAAAASGVAAIRASTRHSVALKHDGSVIAWGCGDVNYGQCTVPAAAASGVVAIAAGEDYNLALKQDGSVIAWGCGSSGTINRDFGQCNVPAAAASGVTAIAAGVFHSLALGRASQTITFGPLAGKTYGDPDFSVSASASSGLPLSFAASGNCTASGSTVHLTGAGSCTVTASQPGDANHNPAPDVSQTFAIARAGQTISFGPLANKTYGDPDFAVSTTASSGLPVSFAASGNCTVSGSTVHLTGAGSCTVTASQPGDANYNSAPDVSQTFAVGKAGQTISFGPLENKIYGAPDFSVSATASSGLAVSFAASGNCTLGGATVHLTGAGLCTVTASQPGDTNYNPAPDVSQTFAVAKAGQSITRPPCRVPKVVGKRVSSARLTIARRHCRTGKVGYAYSLKRKKGIVISQSRRPGRVLAARAKINLIVSRGRRR